MMSNRRGHAPVQMVRMLGHADRILADDADSAAVCREVAVSQQTHYR